MARVVLHIGTHKTATTTLQDTFAANREALAAAGILYPRIGRATGHHTLATHWIGLPKVYHEATPAAEHWRALARHAEGEATLVLSSEEFSRQGPTTVDFAELRGFLEPFKRRTVVCVLRNQLAFLQSIYLELARSRPGPALPALLQGALEDRQADGLFLDYGALYDHLLAGFAADEIVLLSYEAMTRHPGGLLAGFLELTGLLPAAAAAELAASLTPERNSNVSSDPLVIWTAKQIAAPAPPDFALVAPIEAALAETFAPRLAAGARTSLFSAAEAARLAACFEPLNRALEARRQPQDPGFALAPVAVPGDPIWRNQLANPFWIRLARRLRAPAEAAPDPA